MTETREKILAFLNIDLKKKIDKLIMKIITWFHVGFCVFVFGAGALLQLIPFSWFDIIALLLSILSIVLLFLGIRFCKKHTDEWFHYLFAVLCSVLVLLYGWHIYSKGEIVEFGYPRFGWMHLACVCADASPEDHCHSEI